MRSTKSEREELRTNQTKGSGRLMRKGGSGSGEVNTTVSARMAQLGEVLTPLLAATTTATTGTDSGAGTLALSPQALLVAGQAEESRDRLRRRLEVKAAKSASDIDRSRRLTALAKKITPQTPFGQRSSASDADTDSSSGGGRGGGFHNNFKRASSFGPHSKKASGGVRKTFPETLQRGHAPRYRIRGNVSSSTGAMSDVEGR